MAPVTDIDEPPGDKRRELADFIGEGEQVNHNGCCAIERNSDYRAVDENDCPLMLRRFAAGEVTDSHKAIEKGCVQPWLNPGIWGCTKRKSQQYKAGGNDQHWPEMFPGFNAVPTDVERSGTGTDNRQEANLQESLKRITSNWQGQQISKQHGHENRCYKERHKKSLHFGHCYLPREWIIKNEKGLEH